MIITECKERIDARCIKSLVVGNGANVCLQNQWQVFVLSE